MFLPIAALLLAFLLGMALGSFVNALVWRMYKGVSLWGRSQCPSCEVQIRAKHLFPVVSWILLEGKCTHCGNRINVQYPLVEFLGGVIVMFAFARHISFTGGHMDYVAFIFEILFALTLLTLAVFDFRWKLLPIEFMAGATVFFGIWNVIATRSIFPLVLGIAFGALFLGLQVLFSRGTWMGAGDPWIGALLGAGLGWPNVGVGMYLTYMLGGFFVLVLLVLGVVRRKDRIPFAPLLAIGGISAMWFGDQIGLWFARALGWM